MAKSDYDETIEGFRDQEYPMIKDSVYLDHAGSTLCSKTLMDAFAMEIASVLYGNPHSGSWPSQLCSARIDDIRLHLLGFFKADPAHYDLVFVANATAGVKLVLEGMRSLPQGYLFAYHQACHTSLVGAREEAIHSSCIDDAGVQSWLNGEAPFTSSASKTSATLFAYSAQSHLDGRRYPLLWPKELNRKRKNASSRIFTLLDAASFGATSQLDLADPTFAADFVVMSLYKIFGFPDLGVLIVRKSAESVFDKRKFFGGGTVDMVASGKEHWHVRKTRSLHERLEDGTLPFHSIIAVGVALETHQRLFGSMDQISSHTSDLSRQLFQGLQQLRHGNGSHVCVMYTDVSDGESSLGTGPVVSFNVKDSNGAWVGHAEFEKLAILRKMHVRTGGLCSPAGIASALGLQPWEMRKNLSAGYRCGEDAGASVVKPTGVIRASLGAMSTKSDVGRFIEFVKEFFAEDESKQSSEPVLTRNHHYTSSSLRVKTITVYPIKSCGGFVVPRGSQWEVRAEGLAWDREWCLIHRGSGQALSQKRYPIMALLQPLLIFEKGVLRVEYRGDKSGRLPAHVDIPLSTDLSLFDLNFRRTTSRVCGEEISAQSYISGEINAFFTEALGVPCILARFPPGGCGISSRSSKARMQKHQQPERAQRPLPGSFLDMTSSPDPNTEPDFFLGKILLSNESPILMIHSSSVATLNGDIADRGGNAVAESAFRANLVIESSPEQEDKPAYSEDLWKVIRIGSQDFVLLGACQRCQMVCVDQETGERKQEPFITLAKTRRFNGKVYFGTHLRHNPNRKQHHPKNTPPTIQVGDPVQVDVEVNE